MNRDFWEGDKKPLPDKSSPSIRRTPSNHISVWEEKVFTSDGWHRRLTLCLVHHVKLFNHLSEHMNTRTLSPPQKGEFRLGFFCGYTDCLYSAINFHDLLFTPKHQLTISLEPLTFNPHLFNLHFRALERWIDKVVAKESLILKNGEGVD